MKKIFLGAMFCLVMAAAAVSAQSVSGSIGNGSVEKGKATRGTVVMSIPGGLHVNSNRPNSEYAIPTTVRVSGKGFRVSGVSYPRGKNRKFSFSEDTINVYEGRVTFPFTVTVPATYKGTTVRVTVSVRSQACTNEVCYAPKTKTVTLTAKVK
jgi:DsbC/DsbD-like thiol-disulfide interchange protein